ncbi:CRISPR-associated endoribonuclease Cas6 [Campylobacter geochelonis]|uniref:CRISPR-associated endoribonuclease Cas6 n=1 Tax=Campylobacter geochelonis TaxID=1780362 RepID=UPI000770AB3C|nr:CRISPR-associated endoribonuclease Cas6 [Campylobacter geochelonis]CZE47546.1 CRISPR-associated protein Cas6 [Campylobacter geochelonis]
MTIYELKVFIKLKIPVTFFENPEFLSKNINRSFLEDDELRELHIQDGIKPYSIDFLRHDGYRKDSFKAEDEVYFLVRCVSFEIISRMRTCLEISNRLDFEVLGSKISTLKPKFIKSLYTMSPAVVTVSIDNKAFCWTKEDSDISELKRSLEVNLKSKFALYGGEFNLKESDEVIDLIEIKNHKPFIFTYKDGQIFAYRYQIYFAENRYAQNLAKIALALGVGEKGSLAFGFARVGRES